MGRQTTTVPMRRCRICYQQKPKSELQRWVIQEGKLVADATGKLPGRGYYSCCEEHSNKLAQAIKRKG